MEYVRRSMRKSDMMNEMKRSGVAMKREKTDSVALEPADVDAPFDDIVVVNSRCAGGSYKGAVMA